MLSRGKKRNSGRVDSLIGQHTVVQGDVRFSGGLHVDGVIRGSVKAEGDSGSILTLSDRGTIEGEVHVPNIIVNGVIIGDVYASGHVELAANARITGDVHYNLLEMAMGAEVNGKLVHTTEQEMAAKSPPAAVKSGQQPLESTGG